MPNTPCHDAFDAAQKRRANHPLSSGAYKLRDAQRALSRMQETIDALADYLNRPGSYSTGQTLGYCCTTDDKGSWLRSVPIYVAELLGRDILPAIAALTGDDIPPNDVAREISIAQRNARSLLRDCEEQHSRLKAGIGREYSAMKSGHSEIYGLLTDAEYLVSRAIKTVEFREMVNRNAPEFAATQRLLKSVGLA